MKLSGISKAGCELPSQLRLILSDAQPSSLVESLVRHAQLSNKRALPYLFVDAVIATDALNEAEQSRLKELFNAGLAKLQAALTPGSSHDLDLLLRFMAPNGGGARAVTELIRQANQKSDDVLSDEEWWGRLFRTFGVQDQQVRENVQQRVRQAIESESDRSFEQAQQASPMPGEGSPADADQLRGERQREQEYQSDLARQISDIARQRGETQSEIRRLRDRLEKLRSRKQSSVESIYRSIASDLLNEEAAVNASLAMRHIISKIAPQTRTESLTLNEASLLDKLRSAIRSGRTALANPRLARSDIQSATTSANNARAAKLAVKLITDHLRSAFEIKLREAGLAPDQIAQKLKTWDELKRLEAQSGGNPSPDLVQALTSVSADLRKAFQLFHGMEPSEFDVSGFAPDAPEEPYEAEAVDEPLALPGLGGDKRQRAVALLTHIATGIDADAAQERYDEDKMSRAMVKDKPWSRLMDFEPFRRIVENELMHYPNVDPRTIPQQARLIVIRRILDRLGPKLLPS